MELRPDQLGRHLESQPLARCYLAGGPEPLRVVEAADAIRAAARANGFDEREIHHAEPGFDWSQIKNAGATGSLFADKRIVEVHVPSAGPGKSGGAAIKDAAADRADDTLLLVLIPELAPTARKSAWYKAITQAGVAVFAWPVTGSAQTRWIDERARALGLGMADDARRQLAACTEGNLLAADQQLRRLALVYPDTAIDVDIIDRAVADDARFDIFALPTKAIDGDGAGALRALARLRAEGTDPVPITWALIKDLRLVYRAAIAAPFNQIDAVLDKVFMPVARKRQIGAAARRADPTILAALLARAARLDQINKGAASGRAWDELVILTRELATTLSPHDRTQRA